MTKTRGARRVLLGIGVLVAVQAAAVGLYLLLRRPERQAPFATAALSPRAAPALSFQRPDASMHTLAELRGQVVLVHFWATWCEPCRKELPSLLALGSEQDRPGGFALLAISVDDEWRDIGDFLGGALPPAMARLTDPEAARRFGVSTMPDTYVVDARGDIIARYHGARDWSSAAARAELARALEPKP